MSSSRGSSQTRDGTQVSRIVGSCLSHQEVHTYLYNHIYIYPPACWPEANVTGFTYTLLVQPNGYCSCSIAKSCLTLCYPMDCSMPGFSILHYLLEFAQFMSIESVMLSNQLILCCLLLLLPSIFPSIRVFSNTVTNSLQLHGEIWEAVLSMVLN